MIDKGLLPLGASDSHILILNAIIFKVLKQELFKELCSQKNDSLQIPHLLQIVLNDHPSKVALLNIPIDFFIASFSACWHPLSQYTMHLLHFMFPLKYLQFARQDRVNFNVKLKTI